MPKTILVVDDDRLVVQLVKVNLEKQGYAVISAGNGKEAFERLKSQIPDMIILDVHMPDMDGYAFILEKNKTPQYVKIPVVMLTAAKETGPLFKRHNVKAYLLKPVNLEDLFAKVTEAVGAPNA